MGFDFARSKKREILITTEKNKLRYNDYPSTIYFKIIIRSF